MYIKALQVGGIPRRGGIIDWLTLLGVIHDCRRNGINLRMEHITTSRRGGGEDRAGDSFTFCSPMWVSTFLPDRREITAFTFWTSLGSNEEEDPALRFISGWRKETLFFLLDMDNCVNYSFIVFIILSFNSLSSLIIFSISLTVSVHFIQIIITGRGKRLRHIGLRRRTRLWYEEDEKFPWKPPPWVFGVNALGPVHERSGCLGYPKL